MRNLHTILKILTIAALTLSSNVSIALTQDATLVSTLTGPVQGAVRQQILTWEGIPYAAPPVGHLRWQPPKAPVKWTKPRLTVKPGNECPQNATLGVFSDAGGNEDCLYLNVYADSDALARARADGKKLPVWVWLYGGGIQVGQGSDYDATRLARDGKAVVVTLNYRLGVLGFFSHPAIDGNRKDIANYGFMDQTFALRWVHDNISAFGGDPDDVTVAGESSGGGSVVMQVLTPMAQGLFQHAVVMSGASQTMLKTFAAPSTLEQARAKASGFAKAVGCGSVNTAECLRQLPVNRILAAQGPYIVAQSVIDGHYLPEHPRQAFEQGRFNRVTLVTGSNLNEGNFHAALRENTTGKAMTEADYRDGLIAFFGDELAEKVEKAYPTGRYGSPSEAYGAVITDNRFACPSLNLAKMASRYTPTYLYEFADRTAPTYLQPTTFPIGAAHTSELSFLFRGFHGGKSGVKTSLNDWQYRLSSNMVNYFTRLSTANKWNEWPTFSDVNGKLMSFRLPEPKLQEVRDFYNEHQCAFWEKEKF